MAKLWVTNTLDTTRVPFLRGILTSSLTDAGLSFEDAYQTSSQMRQRLEDASEIISRDVLRERVACYLEEHFGAEVRTAFESRGQRGISVRVRGQDGKLTPFSRIQHLRCLESCGLSDDQAAAVSTSIIRHLVESEIRELSTDELGRLTYGQLQEHFGKTAARRYMVWVHHTRSGRPLVLLVGGTTGSGKSTVATEVAHRLGIVRTQSTDMLREVMRMMIPRRLLPVLHTSSFNAGFSLPGTAVNNDDYDSQLTDGYLTQSELLSVPCEAVIQRALREQVSIILEGVHLHPSLLQRIRAKDSATVVMVMLALLDPEQLRNRLAGRELEVPQREASEHLSQFDKIWRLQSFLLSEADREGIPILENDDTEKVTNAVMATLIDTLARDFNQTPDQVFTAHWDAEAIPAGAKGRDGPAQPPRKTRDIDAAGRLADRPD